MELFFTVIELVFKGARPFFKIMDLFFMVMDLVFDPVTRVFKVMERVFDGAGSFVDSGCYADDFAPLQEGDTCLLADPAAILRPSTSSSDIGPM